MAFWRRPAPQPPDLDHMESLALAVPFLELGPGMVSSGAGSICYRGVGEAAFRTVQKDVLDQLTHRGQSPQAARAHDDEYGFTWVTVSRRPELYPSLVADLRTASRLLCDNGWGGQLLCAIMVLKGQGKTQAALVYLFKRGTLYPFAPQAGQTRDTRLELAIAAALKDYVPVEPDLTRWAALWDAPGLRY